MLICLCTHSAQLLYTTQHRTLPIIFHLILQTIIIAQMMSTGVKRNHTEMAAMLVLGLVLKDNFRVLGLGLECQILGHEAQILGLGLEAQVLGLGLAGQVLVNITEKW